MRILAGVFGVFGIVATAAADDAYEFRSNPYDSGDIAGRITYQMSFGGSGAAAVPASSWNFQLTDEHARYNGAPAFVSAHYSPTAVERPYSLRLSGVEFVRPAYQNNAGPAGMSPMVWGGLFITATIGTVVAVSTTKDKSTVPCTSSGSGSGC